MPRPAETKIGTANDLLTGEVVYLLPGGTWGDRLIEAAVATDPADLAALAEQASHFRQVVDIDFVAVSLDPAGRPRPVSLRELIRDRGPTVRPDIGRQSENPPRAAISQ